MPSKRLRSDIFLPLKQHGHAAPKPTVDELLAWQSRANKVNADFLKLDLQTALTFTQLALQAEDGVKRERNQRAARKAYDTILRLVGRVTLTDDEARSMGKSLERLRSDLIRLGEFL